MDIINKISPSKKEREIVNKTINDFLKKIKPRLRECSLFIGGSMGKDSWLSGDHDVDIFVKFPKSYYKKDISKILQERLKKIKYNIVHGSRDYLQVKNGSYLFEIIPVMDIKKHEDALNITDVSPLHVTWVKKNNKNPDEVRLTKAFLKANNLYGAESYKKAFSGYVVELLTIYYNEFNEFISLCNKYLRNPSENFFIHKKFDLNELNKKYSKYDVIVLKAKELQG